MILELLLLITTTASFVLNVMINRRQKEILKNQEEILERQKVLLKAEKERIELQKSQLIEAKMQNEYLERISTMTKTIFRAGTPLN